MRNTLVVGDSWASAVVAGEGDRMGWPLMLGIGEPFRQGVSGSTAVQWADNFEGRLVRAANTPADSVIVSLGGNDAFAAISDGMVSAAEVCDVLAALSHVITCVRKRRTIVLLYADPYCGRNLQTAIGCAMLNDAIRSVLPAGVEICDTQEILRAAHFDGRDIHPNRAGHQAIADRLRDVLASRPPAAPHDTWPKPVVCEQCGCRMVTLLPPEAISQMAPRVLCGSCAADFGVRTRNGGA